MELCEDHHSSSVSHLAGKQNGMVRLIPSSKPTTCPMTDVYPSDQTGILSSFRYGAVHNVGPLRRLNGEMVHVDQGLYVMHVAFVFTDD